MCSEKKTKAGRIQMFEKYYKYCTKWFRTVFGSSECMWMCACVCTCTWMMHKCIYMDGSVHIFSVHLQVFVFFSCIHQQIIIFLQFLHFSVYNWTLQECETIFHNNQHSFQGHLIDSVGWNWQNANEKTTGAILLGTNKGNIILSFIIYLFPFKCL